MSHFFIPPSFENICTFAKSKNKKKLIELLDSNACINVSNKGYTPVGTLAKEGNKEAVYFLIKKFRALETGAILGFAAGGDVKEVLNILSKESNSEKRHELRKFAVQGFGQRGDMKLLKQFLSQEHDPTKMQELVKLAILGLAEGKHLDTDIFNELSQKCNQAELQNYRKMAIQGFGRGGHIEKVNQWLAQETDVSLRKYLRERALMGLAEGGFNEEVFHLIEKNPESAHEIKRLAILGFAQSGLSDQVFAILEQENNTIYFNDLCSWAIQGFAKGGHVKAVIELLSKINDKTHQQTLRAFAIWGLANGYHIEVIDTLLLQEKEHTKINELRTWALRGFEQGKHIEENNDESLLSLISHIADSELRSLIVAEAKKKNELFNESKLLSDAKKINTFMKVNQQSYDRACAWISAWSLSVQTHTWFLQGIQLVKERGLPLEIFLHISSHLIGNENVYNIFDNHLRIVPKGLNEFSVANSSQTFFGTQFVRSARNLIEKPKLTLSEYQQEIVEANQRYLKRITFNN